MRFTKEQEKRILILISIYDLSGGSTKKQVLDNLERSDYLTLSARDTQEMSSRSELHWRNDFAFIRKHLVEEGCIDDTRYNYWQITENGKIYLLQLSKYLILMKSRDLKYITPKTIIRAKTIVNEFGLDAKLRAIMDIVVADLASIKQEEEYLEGGKKERFTNCYERDPKLRSATIAIHGTKCMACGFDFGVKYGKRGEGYIEVHHLRPIYSLKEIAKIDPKSDMVVVCSNCHRIIHRYKDNILTITKLKSILH